MFSLSKREQRVVVLIVLALVAFALVKRYRETGTISFAPAKPAPEMSPTPSPSDEYRDSR